LKVSDVHSGRSVGAAATRSQRGGVRLVLFGKYGSAASECDGSDPTNVTLDDPTKHCEDEVGGVPTPPRAPADLTDTVRNRPEPENPIDPDGLPEDLDGFLEQLGDAS
jgi:hypothetical protein